MSAPSTPDSRGAAGWPGAGSAATQPDPRRWLDPGGDRDRAADDRAGRDDHEHRAALGAAGAAFLGRRPAVGGDRVRAGLRQLAAAGRQAGRRGGPQGDVPDRHDRVRRGLSRRRGGGQLPDADQRPGGAGRVRRAAGADGAVAAGHHVHQPRRAAPVVRGVRRGRRERRGGGPGAGRAADRVPVVAVVPVRERAVRRGGRHRRGGAAGPGRPGTAAAGGRAGRGAGVRRDVLHRVRVLQRRHPFVGHPVDVGVHRGRGGAAGRVRGLGGARARAAAAAADRGRPDPGGRLPGDAVRRRGDVRDLAVPELLHAAEPGLLPGDHRAGVLADGRAGHDRGPTWPTWC